MGGEYRGAIRRGAASDVRIVYIDSSDHRSDRVITPLALSGTFDGATFSVTYIEARCHTAKAARTFRVDRIQELIDPKTGEILELLPWLQQTDLEGLEAVDDGAADAAEINSEEDDQSMPDDPPRSRRLRNALLILVIGYLIGRFRVIPAVLHHFHQHWGFWL